MKRLSRRAPWILAGVVFVLHSAIAFVSGFVPPFDKYGTAARARLAGELPLERLVDFSPLYLDLVTLLEWLVPHPSAVLRTLQTVAVASAVGVFAAWSRRRLPRAVVLGVVGVFALDRSLLVYERVLEPEVLLLAFTVAWLAALDRRPGLAGWAGALAVATRPTLLPVVALGPVAARCRDGRWWSARPLALYAAPVVLVLLGLGVRARVATGSATAPTMNPGTVFFEGNQPLSRGTSAVYPASVLELLEEHGGTISDAPHVLYREVARAAVSDRNAGPREVNAWWAARVRSFLAARPDVALAKLQEKLRRAFGSHRWHDVDVAETLDAVLSGIPLPTVPFGLLTSLAVVGALAEARRWRRSVAIGVLAAAQLGVLVVFYVSARQKLVWLPAVLYFAARGVLAVAASRGVQRAGLCGLVLLAALAVSIPDAAARDDAERTRGEEAARSLLMDVRAVVSATSPVARHDEAVLDALARAPWWLESLRPAFLPASDGTFEERLADRLERSDATTPRAVFDLARAQLIAGRLDRAEELLLSLVAAGEPVPVYRASLHSSSVEFHLGTIARERGDLDAAEALWRRASEAVPGDPWALGALAALGDTGARAELRAWWGAIDGPVAEGRALLALGRWAEAVRVLGPVVEALPEMRDVRLDLALALGRSGRLDEGTRQAVVALLQRPEPLRHGNAFAEIFGRWAAREPADAARALLHVRMLARAGRFAEARTVLDGLAELTKAEDLAERDRLEAVVRLSMEET